MAETRRPTIREVAAVAGVSKSLVSLVYANPEAVSPARRTRVLDAAKQLGYHPNLVARSLAGNHNHFVAILVADLHNPLFAEIVDAARAELAFADEVSLMTSATLPHPAGHAELDRRLLALFRDLRPRGMLIVGSVPDMAEIARMADDLPLVVASAIPEGLPSARTVRGDDTEGMRLLIEHLVEQGHRRIAHIGGEGGPVATARVEAYRLAMAGFGLEAEVRIAAADYSEEAGHRAALELLSQTPPTAITAVNDLAAVGAMSAIESAAPARGPIALTGYDNVYLAGLREISLTTIDPDNAAIGRLAARALATVVAGDDGDPDTVRLAPPRLVVRGSTSRGVGAR